jgi:hypothetical protein
MKKSGFLMRILSVALVFGMALVIGCKTDEDDDGTTVNVSDPSTWTAVSGINSGFNYSSVNGVAYGSGKFVTVGLP